MEIPNVVQIKVIKGEPIAVMGVLHISGDADN
jgi:hypothetical protein